MYRDAETGKYHYPYREYDPVDGRWMQRDPQGESGGLNLYSAFVNDPTNHVDPDGFEAKRLSAVMAEAYDEAGKTGGNPDEILKSKINWYWRRFTSVIGDADMDFMGANRTHPYRLDGKFPDRRLDMLIGGDWVPVSAVRRYASELSLSNADALKAVSEAVAMDNRTPRLGAVSEDKHRWAMSRDGQRLAQLQGIVDKWGGIGALPPASQFEYDRLTRTRAGESPNSIALGQLWQATKITAESVAIGRQLAGARPQISPPLSWSMGQPTTVSPTGPSQMPVQLNRSDGNRWRDVIRAQFYKTEVEKQVRVFNADGTVVPGYFVTDIVVRSPIGAPWLIPEAKLHSGVDLTKSQEKLTPLLQSYGGFFRATGEYIPPGIFRRVDGPGPLR